MEADLKKITLTEDLQDALHRITRRLKGNMDDALSALKKDKIDEFFDALFNSSEDIVSMSVLLKDPKMEDNVFITIVKAVSRLGRNNSALIQEFTQMCSFIQRAPRPRVAAN